jgi:hypothetical protein
MTGSAKRRASDPQKIGPAERRSACGTVGRNEMNGSAEIFLQFLGQFRFFTLNQQSNFENPEVDNTTRKWRV